MLANVDMLMAGLAIVAIWAFRSWSVASTDMMLIFSAIAVYALLSRFKLGDRPAKGACKQSKAQCEDTLESGSESEHEKATKEQVARMQTCASQCDVAGTMRIFRALRQQGVRMSSSMYNVVMDAWINCGNVQAAEDWMEDVREAGMADHVTFNTLIKALVKSRALDKARALVEQMREEHIQPNLETFSELLRGYSHEKLFHEGLSLLEEVDEEAAQTSNVPLDGIVRLLNSCRGQDQSIERVRQILSKFKLQPNSHGNWSGSPHLEDLPMGCTEDPVPVPRLAALISRAAETELASSLCQHEVEITGTLAQVKSVHRTLKQQGFLDNSEGDDTWPLDGHWETDHGVTVVIEGKIVRWSRQNASRLRLVGNDRHSCILALYGSPSTGRLETEHVSAGATKTLRWDNGDVWQSYDGRIIGQTALFSQTMTKVLRDVMQDQAYRARSGAMLRCISKSGLCVPVTIEHTMIQFLGHDKYYLRVRFQSTWSPQLRDMDDSYEDIDPFDQTSRRNPRVGFRHCWAEPGKGCYGQRALVNGEEVDEESFSRHVNLIVKT